MSKILAGLAVLAAIVILSLPAPASAAERRADGVRNVEQFEFSSHRRRYRHRHHVRRYYGPGPYWGWRGPRPYYGHAYPYPRYYYRAPWPWPWW
jgi:hypothetical protein